MHVVAVALAGLAVAGLFLWTRWQTVRIERRFPPRGRFIAVHGGRIHVTERLPAGPERGTVVLLHGASGNQADIMTPLGDRLASRGFHVIAPDRPGHGWSDRPGDSAGNSPAVQAKVLRQAFDAMGIAGAIIVGHSWSGALAVAFALEQPEFTQGLVLLAPVTHPWSSGIPWYYRAAVAPGIGHLFVRFLALPLGMLRIDRALKSVLAPQPVPPGYAATAGLAMVLRPVEFRGNAEDMVGLEAFVAAQAPRMHAITAPTAIVAGDKDGVVMTELHAHASARQIPDATLTVLAGVGHSPHYADPERVVAVIEAVAARAEEAAAPGEASGPAFRPVP